MNHSRRRTVVRSLLAGGAVLSLGAVGRGLAASAGLTCPAPPEETSGPFPADGSDLHDEGRVPHVLATPGISRTCQPLADSAVYLWNCNRDGDYSLYGRGIAHENYLRGVQFTDHEGRVAFQTIFPACYSGRYPHLHLEIFKQSARSLEVSTRVLTTQLSAPREVCSRVYAEAPGYTRSAAQFKGLLPSDDMVFAASSRAELALQTLVINGDLGAGFTGHAVLGIRA